MSGLLRGVLGAVTICALALGAGTLLVHTPLAAGVGLALGLGLAWFGPGLAAKLSERTWRRLGLGAVATFSLAGVIWALVADSMQASDFGVYWRCGTTPSGSLTEQLAICQSKYMHSTPLFWLRSVLYTVPYGAFFGARPGPFDVYNALLHAGSLALLWVAARRALGSAAAFVAVVALGLFPERLFAITLATPDNAAMIFGVAALWLASDDELPMGRRLVLLGGALAALEIIRSAGPLFTLGLLAAALAAEPPKRRSRLVVAVGGALVSVLVVRVLVSSLPGEWPSRSLVGHFSSLDLTSRQTFEVALRWWDHVLPAVPAAERSAFSLDTLLLELGGHGLRYPAYLAAKAEMHFTGSGYAGWAVMNLPENPDTALTVTSPTVPHTPPELLSALLALALGLAMVGAARLRGAGLAIAALAVPTVFFALVLLLNEAQPRYLLVVAPALALLGAAAFRSEPAPGDFALARGFAIVGAVVLLFVAWSRHESRRPHPLELADVVDAPECGGTPSLTRSLQRLRVELPPGTTCASLRVPLGSPAHRVRAVITQTKFPFPFEPNLDAGLDWQVSLGAQSLTGSLHTESVEFVKLEGEGDALLLRVTRARATDAGAFELAHVLVD